MIDDDGEGDTSGAERPDKPSFTELLDWLEGRLTRESTAAMDRSAATYEDDEIQAAITWIEGFRRFALENPVPQPPPIIKQQLRQAFERHHGRGVVPIHQIAHVTFDSRDDVVMASVRGHSEVGEGYQRTFATESHGVLIDVLALSESEVRIEGQVLGVESESSVWEVQVRFPSGSKTDSTGDENGSFSITDVPMAIDTLRLTNGHVTIDIHDPLGESG